MAWLQWEAYEEALNQIHTAPLPQGPVHPTGSGEIHRSGRQVHPETGEKIRAAIAR